jgi:hypothetical protein
VDASSPVDTTEIRISIKTNADISESDITILVRPTPERVNEIRNELGRDVETIGDSGFAMPQWLFDFIEGWMISGDNYSPLHDFRVCKTPGCRNRHLVHQH